MGIILFQDGGDTVTRGYAESAPVIWEGRVSSYVESLAAVSLKASIPSVESAPWTTDFRFLESAPDTREVWDRTSTNNPRHTFLVHHDFANIQCVYGSEIPGGSLAVGADRLVQEADGNRLFQPLPSVVDRDGRNSRCSSLTNSPNCLFATTPDNTKVVIIDPYSDIVKIINSVGETVGKYSMPCGTFAKCIALTASNDRYWLLLWESASLPVGNRFRIEARRFEDSSLFEYEMLEGLAESAPTIADGFIYSEGLDSAPVAVVTPEELAFVDSSPWTTDLRFAESAPVLGEAVHFICSAPVVEDIRVELRTAAPRAAAYQKIREHAEPNYLEQRFDTETDVCRPGFTASPVRTANQKHEKPYQEIKPHYYGHPDHYKHAESSGFPLVDQFFELDSDKTSEWALPPFPENTRAVTAPHFAATETRLIFGTVIHRGAFPWRDDRYSAEDRRHRSSQTLLQNIDIDTRTVINDNSAKMVNMSGAGAFQANDSTGIVMVDSFWDMGADDNLIGYFDKVARQFKQTDIVRYDFNFVQQAVAERNDWITLNQTDWTDSSFKSGPYVSYVALNLYQYYAPTFYDYLSSTYTGHSTSRTDVFNCRVPYNGCLRLHGNTIAWAGQSYRGQLSTAGGYPLNEAAATDLHALKEFDLSLNTLNVMMLAGAPKALLSFSVDSSYSLVESAPIIVPSGSWSFVESAPIVVNYYFEVLESAPFVLSDFQAESAPKFWESSTFMESAPVISNPGYWDTLEIITNTSPNEGMDKISIETTTVATWATNRTSGHPNQHLGTYPYSARFWKRNSGLLKDGNTAETWRVSFLKNLETGLVDRGDLYLEEKYRYPDLDQYRYLAFPYPVQYVSDNDNQVLFGLFRPAEGKSWAGNTNAFKQLDNSYVEDVGAQSAAVLCGNTPIGGVIHKYNEPNSEPVKSVYIPGYITQDTISEYDPFFHIRYFGHSPKDKRLYVIRAFGRRDYFGQGSSYAQNWENPYARGGNDAVEYKVEDDSLPPVPVPGVEYLPVDSGFAGDIGTVYGKYPSTANVPTLDYTDHEAVYSTIKKTMTLANFTSPYQDQIILDIPNIYIFDISNSIPWDESANTYENRDILVYNYDLTLIDRVVSINGIGEDETILHVVERGGVYYILTQVKEEEPFNWAKYHAELAIGQPVKSNFEDTKYGYGFRKVRVYSINSTLYGIASLVSELPWAGHSVGDTLIQEVTATHVWLNWSGVHKGRAGSCLGVGIKRDGSGYVEIPGLISIYQDDMAPSGWALLCYKRTSKGSAYHFVNNMYEFDPGLTRRFVSGFTGEKFPRWGDGEISDLVKLDEASQHMVGADSVYHPPEDWYRPILEGEDRFWNNVHQSFYSDDYYPGGTQPAYSQTVRRRHYNFISSAPVVTESVEKSSPVTWFKITNGGPAIL